MGGRGCVRTAAQQRAYVGSSVLPQGHEGLPPGSVGLVLAWVNRDEVPDGATENAHGWGNVGVPVRGVSVLQHGTLKLVGVPANLGLQCYLL